MFLSWVGPVARGHAKRAPGNRWSSRGTSGAAAASDQSRASLRCRACWRKNARPATAAANSRRPGRESGIVFGSEIMKKAKTSSAPFCRA
jgi:hypothetical protein